jgi:hypothetical protein
MPTSSTTPLAQDNRKPASNANHIRVITSGGWYYSPDLNPIEMAFAKLKAHLRRIGARTIDALWTAIGDICALYSEQECRNYIKDGGYAPN